MRPKTSTVDHRASLAHLGEVSEELLAAKLQLHAWHLRSERYGQHAALDVAVGKLHKKVDQYVETLNGRGVPHAYRPRSFFVQVDALPEEAGRVESEARIAAYLRRLAVSCLEACESTRSDAMVADLHGILQETAGICYRCAYLIGLR